MSVYYIACLPSDYSKGIDFSEQEIKDYFSQNSLDFKQPYSFNLQYLSFDSEEKTKEFAERINKKTDLEKLANGLGLSVKETGVFCRLTPYPGSAGLLRY